MFFQEVYFIVGADTANRLIDPKYYCDCVEERDRAIKQIENQSCNIMVLSRLGHTIDSYCLEHDMFYIEEYNGHDISSTQIREDVKVHDGFYRDKSYDQPQIHLYEPVDQREFGGATKPQF